MSIARVSCLAFSLAIVSASTTTAGLILDRQPHRTGGPSADTEFISFGEQGWQEVADDFHFSVPVSISRIDWWGFYGSNFGEGAQPPTADEVMRIRIHLAGAVDGLPSDVVHEESFTNPQRVLTGRTIALAGAYPERKYRVDLANPVTLNANTTYWMEITQFGSPESKFRWEYSLAPPDNDFAFRAYFSPEWSLAGASDVSLAIQLYDVPEPSSFCLFAVIVLYGSSMTRRTNHHDPWKQRKLDETPASRSSYY